MDKSWKELFICNLICGLFYIFFVGAILQLRQSKTTPFQLVKRCVLQWTALQSPAVTRNAPLHLPQFVFLSRRASSSSAVVLRLPQLPCFQMPCFVFLSHRHHLAAAHLLSQSEFLSVQRREREKMNVSGERRRKEEDEVKRWRSETVSFSRDCRQLQRSPLQIAPFQ